jgi:hypothetical protein
MNMAVPQDRYKKFVELDEPREIVEAISRVALGTTAGQEELNFLNQLLSVRVAGIVANSLQGTASTIGASASQITLALERTNSTVKAVAQEIEGQIADLTAKIAKASTDLQAASIQSGRLSRQLNWLTAALFVAALLTAAATVFQAWETKRQTDLTESQRREHISKTSAQAASGSAAAAGEKKTTASVR